jgi:hypothetical protein
LREGSSDGSIDEGDYDEEDNFKVGVDDAKREFDDDDSGIRGRSRHTC